MRQVIVFPGEDGYWVAECPSLPGCISQGATKEEVLVNIKEAIRGYIAALEEGNLPIPVERSTEFSRMNGMFTSALPLTIPGTAPRGTYEVPTTVASGERLSRASTSFTVN